MKPVSQDIKSLVASLIEQEKLEFLNHQKKQEHKSIKRRTK